jgi:NADPH:quinone reductase-like Zn-dependent oxidoreductase
MQIGPGQLLIRTDAIGVGVGLLRLRRDDPGASPGGEVVGRVAAVGDGVEGFAPGDRVGGVVFRDAYAELVVGVPGLVNPVPEGPAAGGRPSCGTCSRRGGSGPGTSSSRSRTWTAR